MPHPLDAAPVFLLMPARHTIFTLGCSEWWPWFQSSSWERPLRLRGGPSYGLFFEPGGRPRFLMAVPLTTSSTSEAGAAELPLPEAIIASTTASRLRSAPPGGRVAAPLPALLLLVLVGVGAGGVAWALGVGCVGTDVLGAQLVHGRMKLICEHAATRSALLAAAAPRSDATASALGSCSHWVSDVVPMLTSKCTSGG